MMNLNTATDPANFRCLRAERMQQAEHERLVRQALRNRRSRISDPVIESGSSQQGVARPLNRASRP